MAQCFAIASCIIERVVPKLDFPNAPYLSFIFSFIIRKAKTSLAAFCFLLFPSLRTQSQSHTLEIILYASFHRWIHFRSSLYHIPVKDFTFAFCNGEDRQKGGFSGQLDWYDWIADAGKYWWCECGKSGAYELNILTANGADDYKC